MEKMENNDENSGPLTSLQVDRLTATDCNAAARANFMDKCWGPCEVVMTRLDIKQIPTLLDINFKILSTLKLYHRFLFKSDSSDLT